MQQHFDSECSCFDEVIADEAFQVETTAAEAFEARNEVLTVQL
jgi:hypothetical protein